MTECSDFWNSGTRREERGRDDKIKKHNCIDLMLLSVYYIFIPAVLSNFFSFFFCIQGIDK